MKSSGQRIKIGALFPPIESLLSKLLTFLSYLRYKAVPSFSDSIVWQHSLKRGCCSLAGKVQQCEHTPKQAFQEGVNRKLKPRMPDLLRTCAPELENSRTTSQPGRLSPSSKKICKKRIIRLSREECQ